MNQTERHTLPQWDEDDRIMREDFNNAMLQIDTAIPKIAFGSYTGDGASSRTIALPFTPKVVFVASQTGATEYYRSSELRYGGLAVSGKNAAAVAIATNGFTVYNNQASNSVWNYSNKASTVYIYFAIG